jgi:hypothetical protein
MEPSGHTETVPRPQPTTTRPPFTEITDYTVWDDTETDYHLEGYGLIIRSGATLVIKGTDTKPVRVIFSAILDASLYNFQQIEGGQSIRVPPQGSIHLENVEFVMEGSGYSNSVYFRTTGIMVGSLAGVNISVKRLKCDGLPTCLFLGTEMNSRNITIEDSEFVNCGVAISGTSGNGLHQPGNFKYILKNSIVKDCSVGLLAASDWIVQDTAFHGNAIATTADASFYSRVDFIGNEVAITKSMRSSLTGSVSDALFADNDLAIEDACDMILTDVTFQSNRIALNCSEGEPIFSSNEVQWTNGFGENPMNRVNFLNNEVTIHWRSDSDVSLVDCSIYWGTTDEDEVAATINDDGGGIVQFDASVDAPFIHTMFPN